MDIYNYPVELINPLLIFLKKQKNPSQLLKFSKEIIEKVSKSSVNNNKVLRIVCYSVIIFICLLSFTHGLFARFGHNI